MNLFADSSYWIALLNPHDALHSKAARLARQFGSANIVTSEMVLVEVLNSLGSRGPHLRRIGAEAVLALRDSENVRVWPQTSEQFTSALRLYAQASDKQWSATDCASFQIMEAEGISSALTYDRHFSQAGYKALLAPTN